MKKNPLITYALLGVIFLVLAVLLYFKPRQAEIKSVRTERIAVEAQLEDLRVRKRQLDKLNIELEALKNSLAELEAVMPRKREQADILRNFQQMAYDQRLELVRFGGAERETAKDFYTEWPIPIEVAGTFHSLARFFDRILHFPRLFIIDDFSIKAVPNQNEDSTITAVFTAKTFFFLEESMIKKPEPNRPKRPAAAGNEY